MTRIEDDGLYQRAQTRATPLLAKLADLSEAEWDELTHRMRKHFERVMADKGYVIVRSDSLADTAGPGPGLRVEVLAEAMNEFELKANLSVFVAANPGRHRPDCAHVGSIADAYRRLAADGSGGSADREMGT